MLFNAPRFSVTLRLLFFYLKPEDYAEEPRCGFRWERLTCRFTITGAVIARINLRLCRNLQMRH